MTRLLRRARRVTLERGMGYALRAGAGEALRPLTTGYWFYRLFKGASFAADGRRYRYFYHRYNTTWKTERAVEVPIVWRLMHEYAGRPVLEIGNVLSHYFPVSHDIVDKYESGPGVINVDVVDFRPDRRYDLIVSISTLEHVGWDEEPRDPEKLPRAIEQLRGLLAPGGRLVATLPIGYNPHLDTLLRDDRLPLTGRLCLQRISADNRWRQVDWPAIASARVHQPYRGINGLVIGTFMASPAARGSSAP
jgi:SAM-dependent methyltransferase